nr:reverse transcriptase domain-containing protein [Tanacetum cinerariifolium]
TSSEGTVFTYALRFQYAASNNEAEYEALRAGLRIITHMGVQSVHEVTTVVEEDEPTRMTPIIEYLKEGTLPGDRKEASKLRIKARQYELLEGVLYRRSFLMSWLRCVGPLQADYVIQEIHKGLCSMHARLRSVVAKAIRLRYYWRTMHRDARDMIRACNDCQIHRPVTRNPQQPLTLITAQPGEFVYRSNDASHAVDGGKLGSKWEGPYDVTEVLGDGAYKLRFADGTVLPRTWNVANLKKCYL